MPAAGRLGDAPLAPGVGQNGYVADTYIKVRDKWQELS
jgi:hypothetical protein